MLWDSVQFLKGQKMKTSFDTVLEQTTEVLVDRNVVSALYQANVSKNVATDIVGGYFVAALISANIVPDESLVTRCRDHVEKLLVELKIPVKWK